MPRGVYRCSKKQKQKQHIYRSVIGLRFKIKELSFFFSLISVSQIFFGQLLCPAFNATSLAGYLLPSRILLSFPSSFFPSSSSPPQNSSPPPDVCVLTSVVFILFRPMRHFRHHFSECHSLHFTPLHSTIKHLQPVGEYWLVGEGGGVCI